MGKILVVDDAGVMRKIIKNVLTNKDPQKGLGLNHEILEAADGVEGWEQYQKNKKSIDIIFTDWNMPRMDGLQFVKKIRQVDRKTPIIMVTTEGEKTKVLTALKAGVNNYIVKPFTPETLKQKLEKIGFVVNG
jgi:two-component system chemotaxis response regulator CheY